MLNEGIRTTVINARFVKPLDEDLICRVASTCRRLITVEENVLTGGFGSAVLEMLQDKGISEIRVIRLGIPDEFVEHATQAELRNTYGIDRDGIIAAARKITGKTP